ncbi:solute carrier family 15 member 2-like isoform X1 [Oculina patagonica]
MPRSEHEPGVAVLGDRKNRGSSITSGETNGSVSCLPVGAERNGQASSKAPLTWNKSAAEDEDQAGNCCTKTKNWFTKFPKATWPILTTEFGERFSYYGIKTVLVLYLTKDLMFNKANGKSIYHAFSMTSYFTGVIGAMVADSWLGKYRTIAYTLILYSISEVLLTVTSVDTIGQRNSIGPLISLFCMAIACGNIKPCLAAFGGDQFRKDQEHMLELFFAMFYASVNVGAVLCMWFIPMVRTDVQCFGRDCYPAVFAINTVLIIVATVSLFAGKPLYVLKPPAGNVMIRVFKIIGHAISNKVSGSGPAQCNHWLDNASDEYEQKEINDIKLLLRVLKMYIPLPVFWALFHQQGSSWTLQAEQMDGDLGGFTLRSDQIQALNPILVLILIPLYDGVIYPMFERCQFPLSALKKMTGGLVLAAVAFVVCAFVQIQIQTIGEGPSAPGVGRTTMEFINSAPCPVSIDRESFFRVDLKYGERSQVFVGQSGLMNFTLSARGKGCNVTEKRASLDLDDKKVFSAVVEVVNNEFILNKYSMDLPGIDINKAETRVRVIYSGGDNLPERVDVELKSIFDNVKPTVLKNIGSENSSYSLIGTGEYYINTIMHWKNGTKFTAVEQDRKIKFGNFGGYTVVIHPPEDDPDSSKFDTSMYEDAPGTMVSRLLQVPQYVVLTASEVMFSVTGLGFAYSQAPNSMKSVLQSFWLLTVAGGDLIVVILSSVMPQIGVEKEMFLYGGLMGVIAIIFGIMSFFYKYVTPEELGELEKDEEKENLDLNGIPLEDRSPDGNEDNTKV